MDDEKKEVKEEKAEPKLVTPPETGGRGGLDPARYGDWEIGGKCVDF